MHNRLTSNLAIVAARSREIGPDPRHDWLLVMPWQGQLPDAPMDCQVVDG